MAKQKKNPLFLLRGEWEDMTPEALEQYKEDVFQHYRKTGYPYHVFTMEQKIAMLETLKRFDHNSVIEDDGCIRQTMHGLSLAWSYHLHGVDVQNGNKLSMLQAFNNDECLKRTIGYVIKFRERVTDNQIRKTLMILSRVKGNR